MPMTDNYPILQVIFAENFLNLHQLDSARYYWEQAWNNELKQEEKRAEGFSVRSALAQLKTILDYTSGHLWTLSLSVGLLILSGMR